MTVSLHTLPVELVYQIFDHLSEKELFMSTSNVCQRLNSINTCYPRYQVKEMFTWIFVFHFSFSYT